MYVTLYICHLPHDYPLPKFRSIGVNFASCPPVSYVLLSSSPALSNLGVVYSEQGRMPEAEASYRAALRHAPTMADTHFNL